MKIEFCDIIGTFLSCSVFRKLGILVWNGRFSLLGITEDHQTRLHGFTFFVCEIFERLGTKDDFDGKMDKKKA